MTDPLMRVRPEKGRASQMPYQVRARVNGDVATVMASNPRLSKVEAKRLAQELDEKGMDADVVEA